MNLGCKVNRAESDGFATALAAAGGQAASPTEAAVIILNTCTVTREAEAKTRQAIRRTLAAAAPGACVIATGCAIQPGFALEAEDSERLYLEPDREAALRLACGLLGQKRKGGGERAGTRSHAGADTDNRSGETAGAATVNPQPARLRQGLKVQDGCDGQCSFCIVRLVRGPARSLAADGLLQSAAQMAEAGAREIVLTGINLGKYDSGGLKLPGLLKALINTVPDVRFRLSSIEPDDLYEALLQTLGEHPDRVCAHLHLPLQSGSDAILKTMCRPYDAAQFIERVALARAFLPQIALSTDCIVGFPGETDADFAQTIAVCRQAGFMRIHCFRYSARPQTAAAGLDGQVAAPVMQERSQELRQLAAELERLDRQGRAGSCERALVEAPGWARTGSYHRVRVGGAHQPGEFVDYRF